MKKFLYKVCFFAVLVFIIDAILGKGFELLRSKARNGQTYKNEYICNSCSEDILILGSSRAVHHYDPSIIESTLGMSCYNAGEEGCGIIPAYIRYKLVCNRKKPKIVLYEVSPAFDYLQDNDYSAYLGVMRQYTSYKEVYDMTTEFSDELEWLRLKSNLYCNNSKLVDNMKDVLSSPDKHQGYTPLEGVLNPQKQSTMLPSSEKAFVSIDTKKMFYVKKLIKEIQRDSVKLFFSISPVYEAHELPSDYGPILELSKKYCIPIINNYWCSNIIGNNKLFYDRTHLNHNGAEYYSKIVAQQLNKWLN